MQHSWLLHINFFIEGTKAADVDGLINDDKETCSSLWEEVMKCACENKLALSSKEQRIIISSLASVVFDFMARELKEKKSESTSSSTTALPHYQHFREDTDILYRYGGFALHSMIEKRKKKSNCQQEIKLLHLMSDQNNTDLNQGSLTGISTMLLPFLNTLLTEINRNINQSKLKQFGKNMIKVALPIILQNDILKDMFTTCMKEIDTTATNENIQEICIEFTRKVFNARTNEYMGAQKEIDLEKQGKVTDAQQSLRDELKTYSNNKLHTNDELA